MNLVTLGVIDSHSQLVKSRLRGFEEVFLWGFVFHFFLFGYGAISNVL